MNNQDPLAELRDIHLPDAISWWPPAPGWWILALVIILLVSFAIVRQVRNYLHNRYRTEAVLVLDAAWQQFQRDHNTQAYLWQLTELLKRTALTAYPDVPVSGLQGQQWLKFLDSTHREASAQFQHGVGTQLLTLPYQQLHGAADVLSLHRLCRQWLQHHLPPKQLSRAPLPLNLNTDEASHHAAA